MHYHDYTDFPPEFYKAEYYSFYHKLSEDMNPDHVHESEHHLPFEPLRVHSYTDNGFYYYDDHPQTDFREETGYDAYMAGHQQFFDPYQQPAYNFSHGKEAAHSEMIHSSGDMHDPYFSGYYSDNYQDDNFSFGGAMKSMGKSASSFAKGMKGKDDKEGGSSWSSMAGQMVGGALGTGGAESGSMAGMAGQMIGGAMGTKGGKDESFGATMG